MKLVQVHILYSNLGTTLFILAKQSWMSIPKVLVQPIDSKNFSKKVSQELRFFFIVPWIYILWSRHPWFRNP
jgi:hypothetical protein